MIGGKYKGMQGSVTGVTKDMYYVKLDDLKEETRVRKTSVERISKVGLDGIASLRAELEINSGFIVVIINISIAMPFILQLVTVIILVF